ncbi:MAG: 4-hydroxythreonine-4-phosphate dehydrogenase PdxA [Proteobacteria bacterium]|nr:4-hydroxythreonine-4-phosphate dehydrogenase PdxA [Pseudomonadota bacterium]
MLICTLGDPLSINCEAVIKAVLPLAARRPVVIIGSKWQLEHQAAQLGLELPKIASIQHPANARFPGVFLIDPFPAIGRATPQSLSLSDRGNLMTAALNAVPDDLEGIRFAVLTAPINKACAASVGFNFPGQTEFFEHHWRGDSIMLLAGPKLRVALTTNHLPIAKVSESLNEDLIVRKLKVLCLGLSQVFGIKKPRVAVCGLNPHCGDGGLFGHEDVKIIAPAVADAQQQLPWAFISGPISADTAFYRAYQGQFDAVLAMYHDQGLGPLKIVHFDDAVNVTLGLKHLRVSPDHGPAADLYGTGRASITSFRSAVALCERWLCQPL